MHVLVMLQAIVLCQPWANFLFFASTSNFVKFCAETQERCALAFASEGLLLLTR